MKTSFKGPEDLSGVFAVPPLCRRNDAGRSLDFKQNELIVRHITRGGITRLLYGGNAFLYHVPLAEFEQLLDWLSNVSNDVWAIPSIGPTYGRAIDQALLLQRYRFPCVMLLPCGDPRDASGLERGYREIAETSGARLIVYLKEENNLGTDKEAGLDVGSRLVDDGVCLCISLSSTWADGPGYVRLQARVVGEVKVLFRYTLSGL
jgi:hypothetical protein